MPPRREIMAGDRSRFAVRLAFVPDPDKIASATLDDSLSWGAFQIWVGGHNLCGHIELDESMESVHWYLLPLLEWFAVNWDFLFHEEQLPGPSPARDAWSAYVGHEPPPAAVSEEEWEVKRYNWWSRHCLLACREGGVFPRIFIRRWQDLIEVAWGDAPLAGRPPHCSFESAPGYVRLDPADVAMTLYDVLERAAQHLQECQGDSARFAQLVEQVRRLRGTDVKKRLGLLAGIDVGSEHDAIHRWNEVQSYFPTDVSTEVHDALFSSEYEKLVVRGSCHAALMFGTASPTINGDDATFLAGKLVAFFSPNGESARLKHFHRNVPLEQSEDLAWRQGYRLAEELLEDLEWPLNGHWVDVERIYQEFTITVEDVTLSDRTIRGVAIAGPKHQPAVLINRNYEATAAEPRRFTLAHELCHILHDRSYGDRLALLSGPWAPADVERRANAFAAMLLMPSSLVKAAVARLDVLLGTPDGVWQTANVLQTSFTATLEHLTNLRLISEVTRDAIRAEVVARVWQHNTASDRD